MLVQYLKDKHGHRTGVVVAFVEQTGGDILIGWSKCKMSMDKFDRQRGLQIAVGRALKGSECSPAHSIKPLLETMKRRAESYFTSNVVSPQAGSLSYNRCEPCGDHSDNHQA